MLPFITHILDIFWGGGRGGELEGRGPEPFMPQKCLHYAEILSDFFKISAREIACAKVLGCGAVVPISYPNAPGQ